MQPNRIELSSRRVRALFATGLVLMLSVEPFVAAAAPQLRPVGREFAGRFDGVLGLAATSEKPLFNTLRLPRPENVEGVPVMLRSANPAATVALVKRLGGSARITKAGRVSAVVPDDAFDAVVTDANTRFIEWMKPKRLSLEKSVPEIRADLVHEGEDLPQPFDGEGVIIGIVDSGLDFYHRHFVREDGSSRVLYYWNQDSSRGPVPDIVDEDGELVYDYGRECTKEMIENDTCEADGSAIDAIGHGTHVSSTAGGKGRPVDGVAPGVEFIVARSAGFQRLIDAAEYIFTRAEQLGRPCVINMSLGGQLGPHDGWSFEEQDLSALTGPGRIIIAAAGNEGESPIHLGYELKEEEQTSYLAVPETNNRPAAVLDFWFAQDTEIEMTVVVRQGGQTVFESEPIDFSKTPISAQPNMGGNGSVQIFGSTRCRPLAEGEELAGRVGCDFDPDSEAFFGVQDKKNVTVAISPAAGKFTGGSNGAVWGFRMKGKGYFDAWVASQDFFSAGAQFVDIPNLDDVPGDAKRTIGMPASSKDVIAVGAYTTKVEWKYGRREEDFRGPGKVGEIAGFSSRGPSAGEEYTGVKPEITAPGQYISAASPSLNLFGSFQPQFMQPRDQFAVQQGTSMACPHIAGVTALLLQADPTLTPEQVESVLTLSARQDEFTGDSVLIDRYTWGAGKVDAHEAMRVVLGLSRCDENITCAAGSVCENGFCAGAEEGADCSDEVPCATGFACDDGACFPVPSANDDDASGDDDDDAGEETDDAVGAGTASGGDDDDDGDDDSGCAARGVDGSAGGAGAAMLLMAMVAVALRRRRR